MAEVERYLKVANFSLWKSWLKIHTNFQKDLPKIAIKMCPTVYRLGSALLLIGKLKN